MRRFLLVLGAIAFCFFVWPTPYRYDHVGTRLVKSNRVFAALGLDQQNALDSLPFGAYLLLGSGLGAVAGYAIARKRVEQRSATAVLIAGATLALASGLAVIVRYQIVQAETAVIRLDRWTGHTEVVHRLSAAEYLDLGPADTPTPLVFEYLGPAPVTVATPAPPPGFIPERTPGRKKKRG